MEHEQGTGLLEMSSRDLRLLSVLNSNRSCQIIILCGHEMTTWLRRINSQKRGTNSSVHRRFRPWQMHPRHDHRSFLL